jgi:EAL domain-containing protein (putative c-di-GMP-specific phosphodiesterase class I)
MSVTAEGVETEEQLGAVREQGCDEVQGFVFSRPLKPEAVNALLAAEIRSSKPVLRAVS